MTTSGMLFPITAHFRGILGHFQHSDKHFRFFPLYFRFNTEAESGTHDYGVLQGLAVVAFGSHVRAFPHYLAFLESKMVDKTTSGYSVDRIF